MSRSQQPVLIASKQPGQCETDTPLQKSNGAVRTHFGQDVCSPQAENMVAGSRHAVLIQLGPTAMSATTSEEQLPGADPKDHTVSDGVKEHPEEASSGLSSDHIPLSGKPPSCSSSILVSHSPQNDVILPTASTKQNLDTTVESKSLDVSQRREKFSLSGRADKMVLDIISVDPQPEEKTSRNKNSQDLSTFSHKHLTNSDNTEQSMSQGPLIDKTVTNGDSSRVNGKLPDSGVSANEAGGLDSASGSEAGDHDDSVRRHHQHYPFRQAQSEVIFPSTMQRRLSLANVKERGYARLEQELTKAQKALEMKEEEVDELRGIRERLMKEVSDFTAALFEEVNSQLNEAALSEQQARKQLKEANAKIDVLTAEVAALKDLVITSTPSSPNRHLNPQIDTVVKREKGGKPFWKTHRRSTSHHQFTQESREQAEASDQHSLLKEFDNVVFDEFARWRLQPTMEFKGQFFTRVQQEDIQPCLSFKNTRLADKLLQSVKDNTLSIELIRGDQSFPRKCCLSDSPKLCNYKIKFEGDDECYSISQMSRNRIATVCDFYAYLRYIVQGLVKCSDKEIFAELTRLRSQMTQARLGLI